MCVYFKEKVNFKCLSRLFLLILLLYKLCWLWTVLKFLFRVQNFILWKFNLFKCCIFLWKSSYIALFFANSMLKLPLFAQPLTNMSYTLNLLFYVNIGRKCSVMNIFSFFSAELLAKIFSSDVSKQIKINCNDCGSQAPFLTAVKKAFLDGFGAKPWVNKKNPKKLNKFHFHFLRQLVFALVFFSECKCFRMLSEFTFHWDSFLFLQ